MESACVTGEEMILGIGIPSDRLLNDGPVFAHFPRCNTSIGIQLP
jgi:hypothetical protein